ncbi:hypothetical protein [Pseudidiomarina sp. YC-516-91]|uniref:hypothetical protein n=1 Tax=Pseudidiomarina salilacus TaxID=3384452 RepID=UPI0039847EDB
MMTWISFLGVVLTSATTPTTELAQQLQQVSQLRIDELAELRAATQVRKLQYELQAAQLRSEIANIDAPSNALPVAEQASLAGLRLQSVIRTDQQLWVRLSDAEQQWLLTPAHSEHGFVLEVEAQQLIVSRAGAQRRFHLPEGL